MVRRFKFALMPLEDRKKQKEVGIDAVDAWDMKEEEVWDIKI